MKAIIWCILKWPQREQNAQEWLKKKCVNPVRENILGSVVFFLRNYLTCTTRQRHFFGCCASGRSWERQGQETGGYGRKLANQPAKCGGRIRPMGLVWLGKSFRLPPGGNLLSRKGCCLDRVRSIRANVYSAQVVCVRVFFYFTTTEVKKLCTWSSTDRFRWVSSLVWASYN